jgi:hypothetical protein
MKFTKRLKFFSIGFSIGILFVYFLFKDREFKWSWLPGNRVTEFILQHPIKINTEKFNSLNQKESFSNSVFNTIINGDVVFSKSETKGLIKSYLIENKENKAVISISFQDSISQLIKFNEITFSNENILNQRDTILNIDSKNFLMQISDKDIRLGKIFSCQLNKFNINNEVFENSFNSIRVNWNISKPFLNPYAFYIAKITIENIDYDISFENGSNKLRFKNIQFSNSSNSDIIFDKECK